MLVFSDGLSAGIKGGIIGGITGGVLGGVTGGLQNRIDGRTFFSGKPTGEGLLAYEYTVNAANGDITKISDLGGADLHFFDYGYYTDGGTAFQSMMSEIVEGANTINTFRFWESAVSTISSFVVPATGLTGYFMEPNGPSSGKEDSGVRIPEGKYNISPHWRTHYSGRYTITNQELMNRPGVLMHMGKNYHWTEGCLLPASSWSTSNTISGSLQKLEALQSFLDQNRHSKLNIFDLR